MSVVEIKDLHKTFPGVKALNGVNISIEEGEIRGLIGPNGSGKSTLISNVMGFYKPEQGEITYNGERINDCSIWERVGKGINLTHQEAMYVSGMSIYRHIELGVMINGFPISEVYNIAETVDLIDLLHEDPNELTILSAKKLEIAKALSTKPKFLMLDECFAGLCYEEGVEINKILQKLAKERNMTMLIIDHNLALVKLVAAKTTVINRGEIIAEGSFEEILSNEMVIQAYMG